MHKALLSNQKIVLLLASLELSEPRVYRPPCDGLPRYSEVPLVASSVDSSEIFMVHTLFGVAAPVQNLSGSVNHCHARFPRGLCQLNLLKSTAAARIINKCRKVTMLVLNCEALAFISAGTWTRGARRSARRSSGSARLGNLRRARLSIFLQAHLGSLERARLRIMGWARVGALYPRRSNGGWSSGARQRKRSQLATRRAHVPDLG